MKKRGLVAVMVILLVAGCLWFWLKDRPTDIAAPPGSFTSGGFVFHPDFGPKTPQEAKEYVENRWHRSWEGHFLREMRPEDEHSGWGKQLKQDAIDTLQRRWRLTLEMNQEEIDAVCKDNELAWEFIEQRRTARHKLRVFLGLAK
ncbi:hypothetical protein COW95_03630 [Candidatus Peregrinibacteria bacterium CG22_combo_CG10-13_8_21_14_all_49_11]|nr:MAG: hypothetical protein COW95_03630 [Candidatus Peregrinibacteria bacterium CG22_combo_CG10-13_8_21_14_all_49_11]